MWGYDTRTLCMCRGFTWVCLSSYCVTYSMSSTVGWYRTLYDCMNKFNRSFVCAYDCSSHWVWLCARMCVCIGCGQWRSMVCKVDSLLACLLWQLLKEPHWLQSQMCHTRIYSRTHAYTQCTALLAFKSVYSPFVVRQVTSSQGLCLCVSLYLYPSNTHTHKEKYKRFLYTLCKYLHFFVHLGFCGVLCSDDLQVRTTLLAG